MISFWKVLLLNETVFLVVDRGLLNLRNANITKLRDSNVEYEKTNETGF